MPFSLLLAGLLWIVSLGSLIFQSGAGSWIAGFIYVTYDTALIAFVAFTLLRRSRPASYGFSPKPPLARPKLAVMITGRNEAPVISDCLTALVRQTDPPEEVLWVDDGSTDEGLSILERWSAEVDLPFRLIAKSHSGKASSMNAGWPTLSSDIVVTIDADTRLEPKAVAALRRAFIVNPRLAVTGGLLDVHSREKPGGTFESFQRFEYMRSFMARRAWMSHRALILVSGAFAAYRKTVLVSLGGFDPESRVEDYELTHRIYRLGLTQKDPWEVEVCLDALATTDVPGGLIGFLKQRERWFAGFIETHWQNRDLVGNPKLGALGRWMLPIKSADMVQPLFGLTAFAGLLIFIFKFVQIRSADFLPPIVLVFLGAKISVDLVFHFFSVFMYYRWKNQRVPLRIWLASSISTLLEPFSFQLCRHVGALLGWTAIVTGRRRW